MFFIHLELKTNKVSGFVKPNANIINVLAYA